MPPHKVQRGYRFEKDKFAVAGLTPLAGETVAAPRVAECPVQLEATVEGRHIMAAGQAALRGHLLAIEVNVTRIHLDERIMMSGEDNRIDPDEWHPLIMSFQQFYGLAPGRLLRSELAEVPEKMYRPPRRG
jgi:flavin reductase (DIM6/NTAB) family NADH-FMN oxidoreductase RutF